MRAGLSRSNQGGLRGALSFASGFVFALCIIVVPYWTFSRKWPRSNQNSRPIVLCFGDSITQHGFNPLTDGWVAQLGHYWGRRADIINRGFSGYNSKWGATIAPEVMTVGPDLVTIFFGANDAVVSEAPTFVPIAEYGLNLEKIVTVIRKGWPSTSIIMITPPPVWEPDLEHSNLAKGKKIARDRVNERTMEYALTCKRVAKKFGLPVVDLWTGLGGSDPQRQEYLSDGLHLSQKGNQKVFELIKDTIAKELPQWLPEKMSMDKPQWFELVANNRN